MTEDIMQEGASVNDLQNPALLIGFRNEIGGVAGGVYDFLRNKASLKRIGSLNLQDYFTFDGVAVENDTIQFPDCGFYAWSEGNLLFYWGDVPHRNPYEYTSAILDISVNEYHSQEVITLGGFVAPISHLSPRRVFGTVTQADLRLLLEPYDVNLDINYQTPSGGARPSMNHFLLWNAQQHQIAGYSLWVEVPFYLANVKDPKGTRTLLDVLDQRFALGFDLRPVEEEVEQVNQGIELIKKGNPDISRYLGLLEQGIALSQEEGEKLAQEVIGFFHKRSHN